MAAADSSEPQARTRGRLCGSLGLEIDGLDVASRLPGGQATALLCYLLASPERAADRDELIAVLWPENPPRDPQGALRPILSRLRRVVEPAAIEGRDRLRLLLPDPVWIDVDEATRRLEAARAAARRALWESVRKHSEATAELLRPGFLQGTDGDWVDARRREVEELLLEALDLFARAALAARPPDVGAAERASRELISRSPYRETGYRFLMEALAAGGNVAEALRVYDDLRVLLRDELGAAPAAEVQELHTRLLAGETVRPSAPAPTTAGERRAPLPGPLAPRERSAFVGREPELALLRDAWREATDGERRLVVVAGEPGIGKTRLTRQFALQAHEAGTVLRAACAEDALLPYQAFVEALRHYARTRASEWAHLSLGPGGDELTRLIPELAEARSAESAVATSDPETRRYMLFEAVSLLLAEAAAGAPVLLVLDDLHWADRATLHLLRHVMRSPQEAALLIVGTYRPAEVGSAHPLAELIADLRRDALLSRITLGGLEHGHVAELIASHAGHEAGAGVVSAVHEQTEGNPFFIEEVMRHLIETGRLFERGGRWSSALTADEIGVPEGVKDVLDSRLARLSEACRCVLSHAAVLGREFSFEVLAAMAESPDQEVIEALEEGVAAQLLVEEAGGSNHAFTHALVRETIYGELSTPRRQRLHTRAAQAIEEAEGDTAVAALALHHRLAGPSGDASKAIEYSLRAGQEARELSAWEEAAAHWEGALAIMERAGGLEHERARLLVALGELMVVVGDLGRQIACLEAALGLYERLGDRGRAAQVHSRLGMAHSLIDSIYAEHLDVERAFHHFDAARPVLEQDPLRKPLGHLETGVSTALTYRLRIPDGIEAAARGMEIGERLGDEALWTGAAQAYGWHKIVGGDLSEGFAITERAFEAADREQRPFLAFMGSNIRGQWTWGLGAPDEAQAYFERPLRLPYVGKTAYRHEIADGVGRCHASRGELEDARRLLPDARAAWFTHSLKPLLDLWDGRWGDLDSLAADVLATSRRTGNRWDEWAAQHFAGRVRYLRGELAPALKSLEEGLAIVVAGGARYFELWARPDLARTLAEAGNPTAARTQVERCLEIVSDGEDWRGLAGRVTLAEAIVLTLEDRLDEANSAFNRAQEAFARYRLPGDEADALHAWGRTLGLAGDRPAATEKLDEALDILRRHGAGSAWLERVRGDRRTLGKRGRAAREQPSR
jgi:DNA-binding SARP family transcriptional activator/tetratricopeptide (TPR) repeat protein